MISDNSAHAIAALRNAALTLPYLAVSSAQAAEAHLEFIHRARCRLVRTLLPAAATICDLGGANAPLYRMGYPHPFQRLVMVDLPEDERHPSYGKIELAAYRGPGQVQILYGDMTRLDAVPDASFDLVWSGQSIEHVSEADGRRMCAAAHRILKPGGGFCLDTPNGDITRFHSATARRDFIHPEHKIEYEPAQLRQVLIETGFDVEQAYGICHMPRTVRSRTFDYRDFILGDPITLRLEESYIQFYSCRKPG